MKSASPWQSIQFKLPALLGALLLLVVAALTFLSYRALERTLLEAAEARLQGAARILGEALRPGLQQRVAAAERLAASPALAGLLVDSAGDRAPAEAALRAGMPTAAGAAVEVRGPDGRCLGVFARATDAFVEGGCMDFGALEGAPHMLPLIAVDDTARIGVVAPVPGAGGAPRGWVVERRPLASAAAGTQLIEGLIGTDARVYLANADGSVWTDLARVVPAPHAEPAADRLVGYEVDGEERMAMATELTGTPLLVWTEFPRAAVLALADAYLRRALLTALLLVVVGCAGVWLVTHRIVLPLRQATQVAEGVAAGSYGNRIVVRRDDEIGRLAAAFNHMADEVQRSQGELEARVERRTHQLKDTLRQLRSAQEELVRKEKLAMLGQLSSSVGHELRNPLGVMSNAVYFLKMVLKDPHPKVTEYLEILKQQVVLSEKIISDLLDFARVKPPQTEPVSVPELVRHQLDRVGRPERIEIVTALSDGLPQVLVDKVQVGQVLFNLLTNAVQAMDGGGTLRVSAVPTPDASVRVDVTDTGVGIGAEDRERIFDPLFTTKARGIGLGLSVARSLARANRGDILVESEPGRGSTFTVTLPTAPQGAPA